MDSCVKSEVTRLRRRAWRCEDLRFRCRYLRAPPAMVFGFFGEGVGWVIWLGGEGGECSCWRIGTRWWCMMIMIYDYT